MQIHTEKYCELCGNCLLVHVPRELDHHEAGQLRQEVDGMINAGHVRQLVFDFSRTEFMDSSGIGLVMGRYKAIKLCGGCIIIENTGSQIKKVMRLAGLDRLAIIK